MWRSCREENKALVSVRGKTTLVHDTRQYLVEKTACIISKFVASGEDFLKRYLMGFLGLSSPFKYTIILAI
jgi:hypothetical protein